MDHLALMRKRLQNLQRPAGAQRGYEILAAAEPDAPTRVLLYDEIGGWGVMAGEFVQALDAVKGDLDLRVNSPGGDVFDGIAIYEALAARPGMLRVTVDALAASVASVIAMAASPGELVMGKSARMMIHDGWGMCVGNAADMAETAKLLNEISGTLSEIYAERTGQSAEHWREAMLAETWYSAQAAVDAGLADRVADRKPRGADARMATTFDLSIFRRAPQAAVGKPYRPEPYKREEWETVACPSCGKYNDDDSAYCGQCGAKLAGREDVHEDDTPPDDGGGDAMRSASRTGVRAADVDHTDWDGDRAMANGAASDDPAAFYKGICAGRKAGDPAKQGSWALPYRYHPGDAPNADGVRNALARLPQTEDLTNRADAEELLNRLMKQINPDHDDSADRLLLPLWNATENQGDAFAEAMKGVLA